MTRAWALTLAACVGASPGPTGDGPDPDLTDTDPADTAPDVPDLDCSPGAFPTDPVPADACVVVDLACGVEVLATTTGGSTSYDRDVWAGASCLDYLLGDPGHLDAPERVYALTLAPDQRALVRLASPCGRFDLRAVSTAEVCHTEPLSCTTASGDFSLSSLDLPGTAAGRRWELVVDGYDGDEGNFRLSVDCSP